MAVLLVILNMEKCMSNGFSFQIQSHQSHRLVSKLVLGRYCNLCILINVNYILLLYRYIGQWVSWAAIAS